MEQLVTFSPPEVFDFEPSSWHTWFRRFERFRTASGLASKEGDHQVNSLVYIMGDKADDILSSLPLTPEQLKDYEAVKRAFDNHFFRVHNVIYERAKFNKRSQEVGESAEHFIMDVHKMAEYCNYGDLREEMIRDRIVVGIRDAGLSERLQLNAKLDLATAIAQ
ncbi:hypothetical protein LDENG_00184280, partial [Scomber scombrus]